MKPPNSITARPRAQRADTDAVSAAARQAKATPDITVDRFERGPKGSSSSTTDAYTNRSKVELPTAAKLRMRTARDQNLDALITRAGLPMVHGAAGFFEKLNPSTAERPFGTRVIYDGKLLDGVDQRYALLEAIGELITSGYEEEHVEALVEDVLAEFGNLPPGPQRAHKLVGEVLRRASAEGDARLAHASTLGRPEDLKFPEFVEACRRLGRIRWIESRSPELAPEMARSYENDIRATFSHGTKDQIFEVLDGRFENAMDQVLSAEIGHPDLKLLPGVRYFRVEGGYSTAKTTVALDTSHPSSIQVRELRSRLEQGEESSLGGRDYPLSRFPESALKAAVGGETAVFVVDGSLEEAVRHVRESFPRRPDGLPQMARCLMLEGTYSSSPRVQVTLEDGSGALLMFGQGKSRLAHNAETLQLYTDDRGRRIPLESMHLVETTRDRPVQIRADLEELLVRDTHAQPTMPDGARTRDATARLMIVTNPKLLERAFEGRWRWGEATRSDAQVALQVAHLKEATGQWTRCIVAKVGGPGLHGDLAGEFLKAFDQTMVENGIDVIRSLPKNGTAGGLSGTAEHPSFLAEGLRGLGHRETGLVMPDEAIIDARSGELLPMKTLVAGASAALQGVLAKNDVEHTSRHIAMTAPADQTFEMIDSLIEQGGASVDAEAAAIQRAINELGAAGRDYTFTPIYTFSDDPREARGAPSKSLARRALFFEGSVYDEKLFESFVALVDEGARRHFTPESVSQRRLST